MAWMAIATAAVSASQQAKQKEQEAGIADYNAGVADNEGAAARQSADYEAQQYGEKAKQVLATQRANAAASGLGLEGSPLDVMDQTASQAAYDQLLIRYSGTAAEARAKSQASLDRLSASTARGDAPLVGGGTFLSGISSLQGVYGAKK